MAASSTGVPVEQPSLEQKIVAAAAQTASIVAPFSKAAAEAIQAGAAIEPVISGILKLFEGLFSHHAKQAVASRG